MGNNRNKKLNKMTPCWLDSCDKLADEVVWSGIQNIPVCKKHARWVTKSEQSFSVLRNLLREKYGYDDREWTNLNGRKTGEHYDFATQSFV